jgi:ubiquinone/menaquinone biosynthesis C-methylase UbiE
VTAGRRDSRRRPTVQNRRWWDRTSDWYDRRNRRTLERAGAEAWGVFRVPESEARWLPAIRGRDVLEVGCGAARWGISLRSRGARIVGLDQSRAQLAKARSLVARRRLRLPLVRANAEQLPFRDRSFDLVFCDWGALTFADPRRTVPECARVLRRGGHLVFSTGSWLGLVGWDRQRDRLTRNLRRPYFGPIGRPVDAMFEFRPGAGEWIELFVANGFVVERMSETRAPPGARTTYLSASDVAWARNWPVEMIWRVRRG